MNQTFASSRADINVDCKLSDQMEVTLNKR